MSKEQVVYSKIPARVLGIQRRFGRLDQRMLDGFNPVPIAPYGFADPYDDSGRIQEHFIHLRNLMILLRSICLVDTQGIYPEIRNACSDMGF